MGLALELLATLIAGRQALSLHLDGTIVVERQAGCCDRGRFIWGASGPGLVAPAPGPALARPSFSPFFLSCLFACLLACLLSCFPGLGLGLGWAGWSGANWKCCKCWCERARARSFLVPGQSTALDGACSRFGRVDVGILRAARSPPLTSPERQQRALCWLCGDLDGSMHAAWSGHRCSGAAVVQQSMR
jgi:hypothetical protein